MDRGRKKILTKKREMEQRGIQLVTSSTSTVAGQCQNDRQGRSPSGSSRNVVHVSTPIETCLKKK